MKYNFSCTELLLVAGSTALTLVLFTGAVSSMKEHPKTIACAQVMRRIEQKTAAFENDNGGYLISGNNQGKLWGVQLAAGNYFSKDGFYDRGKSQPKGFECPAETRERTVGSRKYLHPTTGIATSYDYGLNWLTHQKITKAGQHNIARSKLKNPAKLMRMLEGTKFALHPSPSDLTDRHGDTAGNVVFEDGHITFMEPIPYRDCENYKPVYWRN